MMKFTKALALAGLAAGFIATSAPAMAQDAAEPDFSFSGNVAITNDYVFRGFTQTNEDFAIQGGLDLAHSSGLYVGTWASNVEFGDTDTTIEIDFYGGFKGTFGNSIFTYDIGAIYYTYPGYTRANGTQEIDYLEGAVKASKRFDPVTLLGALYVSPNFFGRSGTGVYLEGGADVALPLGFTASGRFGYQWIEREPRFGTPDYATWSGGISREVVAGVTLAVAYHGTNISRSQCSGGQKICDDRMVVTLSRKF